MEKAIFEFKQNYNSTLAFNYIEQAIELNPKNPRGYHNMGIIAEKINDSERAIDSYKKASRLTQNDPIKLKQYEDWIEKLSRLVHK